MRECVESREKSALPLIAPRQAQQLEVTGLLGDLLEIGAQARRTHSADQPPDELLRRLDPGRQRIESVTDRQHRAQDAPAATPQLLVDWIEVGFEHPPRATLRATATSRHCDSTPPSFGAWFVSAPR